MLGHLDFSFEIKEYETSKGLTLQVYSPEREKEVLWRAERTSEGPLEGVAVRRLFERIIDESRRVEREASTA